MCVEYVLGAAYAFLQLDDFPEFAFLRSFTFSFLSSFLSLNKNYRFLRDNSKQFSFLSSSLSRLYSRLHHYLSVSWTWSVGKLQKRCDDDDASIAVVCHCSFWLRCRTVENFF